MDLALTTRTQGSWAVVEVAGELDLSNAPELHGAVAERLGAGDVRVAIDLSEVSFMDSSALGVLVTSLKRAREHEGDVILVGVHGSPARVLEVTGLDRAFTLIPSVADLPAA